MTRIDTPDAAIALFAALGHEPLEVAAFAYLDAEWVLLGMRHIAGHWVDAADIPVRDVAGDALALGAAAVVMAHNHPGGDPAPSLADRDATRRLARALHALDIRLVDHVILAANSAASFRALSLL